MDFNDLRKYLDNVDNINRGGCGLSALVMYRWLRERGIKSEIIFLYEFDYNEIYQNYDNGEYINTPFHVVLFKDGILIDSYTGEIPKFEDNMVNFTYGDNEEDYYYCFNVGEEILVDVLQNGNWNKQFDRNKNFYNIVENTGVYLGDIEYEYLEMDLEEEFL